MATPIEKLRFNLQERQFPYFEEQELIMLLENNGNDVNKASKQGCIMKAQDDSINLGPLKKGSNREYWIKLSRSFDKGDYKTSMGRCDGC